MNSDDQENVEYFLHAMRSVQRSGEATPIFESAILFAVIRKMRRLERALKTLNRKAVLALNSEDPKDMHPIMRDLKRASNRAEKILALPLAQARL